MNPPCTTPIFEEHKEQVHEWNQSIADGGCAPFPSKNEIQEAGLEAL
jgi:hypothetical protein